jgi:hypothetical protein
LIISISGLDKFSSPVETERISTYVDNCLHNLNVVYMVKFFLQFRFKLDLCTCLRLKFDSLNTYPTPVRYWPIKRSRRHPTPVRYWPIKRSRRYPTPVRYWPIKRSRRYPTPAPVRYWPIKRSRRHVWSQICDCSMCTSKVLSEFEGKIWTCKCTLN